MKKLTLSHLLVKNFDLRQQEIPIFLMLFAHSFFLGLAGAFYFTPANSEFIRHYGSEQLPYAYMVSGIAGFIFTQLYSWLQKSIDSRKLFIITLAFMTVVTMGAPFLINYVDAKHLSFFVFIWAWPFLSMVGIETGALSLKFLNLVQVKRIFALFSIGGVLAAMSGYLIIPLLNKVFSHSYMLLFISAVSFLVGIVTLVILYNKYPEKLAEEKKRLALENKKLLSFAAPTDGTGLFQLLRKDYFKYIFICATLSMTIIYITDFSFLSTVKIQIHPDNTAQFLTLVYGGLKIGELLLSFYSAKIMSRYGVKLGLMILPVCMVVVVSIAAVVGLIWSVNCIMFLILITVNKSQERVLRRGLDDPAFNILYQPLPDNEKAAIQTKVGVVQQFSTGIAGVTIWGVNQGIKLLGEYDFRYFLIAFVPILVLWAISSKNLYLSYKATIKQIVKDISNDKSSNKAKNQYGAELLRKFVKNNNPKIQENAVTILSETSPRSLEGYAAQMLETENEIITKAILRNIDPTWRRRIGASCKTVYDNSKKLEIRLLSERAASYLDYTQIKDTSVEEFNSLITSKYVCDQIKMIKIMFSNDKMLNEDVIFHMLDSQDRNVKSAAITLAGKLRTPKMIDKLISLLESAEYYNTAGTVLLDMGDRVLPALNEYFEKCGEPSILLRIIELYAKFGSSPAKANLVKNINYPNREVQLAIISALNFCKFQAVEEKDILTVKNKISEVVENIVWIMSSLEDIEDEKNTLKLFQALDMEKENNIETLFNLLSFINEPRLISLIQKNIIGKNNIFAVEIIDNNFPKDLKQIITPLFDDLSSVQKVKKLSVFFPQEKLSFEDRLKAIIKRDYYKLDTWTISKAVELLGKLHKSKVNDSLKANVIDYNDVTLWNHSHIEDVLTKIRKSEIPDEVFLCLYHVDEIVYSVAAKIVYEENPLKCSDYLVNMTKKKQALLSDLKNDRPLLMDRIRLIKKHPLFSSVPDKMLVKIAESMRVESLNKGEEIDIETHNGDIIILMKGTLCVKEPFADDVYFFKNDIIVKGLNLNQGAGFITAKKDSSIILIDRFSYFDTLVRETEIIPFIFDENNRAMRLEENQTAQLIEEAEAKTS
ncbi:MAG: hypothetical protein II937_16320 [Bacteroidales bacterium]|nr:hypothetical protein [Bacteroidales bacterium]